MIAALHLRDTTSADKPQSRHGACLEFGPRRMPRESNAIRSPAIRAIGNRAHAALVRSGGAFEWMPGGVSTYAVAASEIIWIGHGIVVMHPRAVVLVEGARAVAGDLLLAGTLAAWRPTSPAIVPGDGSGIKAACEALARGVLQLGAPRGFGATLVGDVPAFPLDRALPRVRALADAFNEADANAIHAAALPLLGLGPGLTPSGDDLVGAALFARQAIATSPADISDWKRVAWRLSIDCESRTHAIGAALFRDLASGQSFAPLHRLLHALVADDLRHGLDAARELVAIGHSSGWDMLTGLILGVTGHFGPPHPSRQ